MILLNILLIGVWVTIVILIIIVREGIYKNIVTSFRFSCKRGLAILCFGLRFLFLFHLWDSSFDLSSIIEVIL
jgi:hypothetical protein